MDFFFEDIPSTSHSTPKKEHEDSQMTEDRAMDSTRGQSSSVSMTESQDQNSRSSIHDISRGVEELVMEINHSRTSNQNMMDSFEENLLEKVREMCHQMKGQMFAVYEKNSDDMQVKLQELSEVLESCTKLNDELLEATQALVCLREGLAINKKEP